ncbi:MAG: tetratricopeptide repeat protein, partial [Acidobacteriota bacterium]
DLAGRLLAEKGEIPEAVYDFERAIRLRPHSAPHLYDFALALARAGRFDEARQNAEAALRAEEKFADGHELLGGLFERERRWPQAAAAYRRALELRPEPARTHFRLGTVLAAQGDVAGAAEQLREAAKGSDAPIAQQAARALQQLGVR